MEPSPEPAESPVLAARLRAARERLGVSTRELSRLAGIPLATVSRLEGGRDPRWSTLMRYLELVPGLRASDLLMAPRHHPPASSRALWKALRRAVAQGADAVTVTSGPGHREVLVDGLRSELKHASALETRRRLMQLGCTGPSGALRLVGQAPMQDAVRVEHEGAVHEFEITGGDEPVVRARNRMPAGSEKRVEHAAGYAVRRLTLRAEIPEGTGARLLAWPISRRIEGRSAEMAACAYPGGRGVEVSREGALLSVTVADVLPGLVHVLDWSGDPELDGCGIELGTELRPADDLASIVRELREAAGLSARALADAMHVSHATVVEAERGRDIRASTLRRYLGALPHVPPQRLLPAREADGELTHEETWSAVRDVHGLEAASIEREITHAPDRTSRLVFRITGLRTLDGSARRIATSSLHGVQVHGTGPQALVDLQVEGEVGDEDVRQKIERREVNASPMQHLLIPPASAASGVTITSSFVNHKLTPLTRAHALERYGPTDERVLTGNSLPVAIPARVLRLIVHFPPGSEILDAWPVAHPFDRQPDEERLGLLDRAHAGRWRFEWKDLTATLEVDLPLYGLKYGIAWWV